MKTLQLRRFAKDTMHKDDPLLEIKQKMYEGLKKRESILEIVVVSIEEADILMRSDKQPRSGELLTNGEFTFIVTLPIQKPFPFLTDKELELYKNR